MIAEKEAAASYLELQRAPQKIDGVKGNTALVFVEKVYFDDARLYVIGWTSAQSVDFRVNLAGVAERAELGRYPREDVAKYIGSTSGETLGFFFSMAAPQAAEQAWLEIGFDGKSYRSAPLTASEVLEPHERALFAGSVGALFEKFRRTRTGSEEWWRLVDSFPVLAAPPDSHHGFIEGVLASPLGGGVAFGWALHSEETVCWLEFGDGNACAMSAAFRRRRSDIETAFAHVPWSGMDSAFIAYLPELKSDDSVRLRMATDSGLVTVNSRENAELLSAEPRRAAEKLFSIETEDQAFHTRPAMVDWPVLSPLIARRGSELRKLPVSVRQFGTPPASPEVSMIVPLYRRYDFMEHQLLEFAREPDFAERFELIYVIDDPGIIRAVVSEATWLSKLYDVPFTLVWSAANRGFSGANNLGASQANSEYLLFLNSDVIPERPGWIDPMLRMFAEKEKVGIVGAQLLSADGSLQHAGMEFRFYEELGIWTNQHPVAGLAPEFDTPEAQDVPAVTGACLLIPRAVFDQLGGWDSGYLIGDFEDSDLCLAARSNGYRVLYQPAASLTHLERQSFVGVGADSFRLRIMISNAVRHQEKWKHLLEAPDTDGRRGTSPGSAT